MNNSISPEKQLKAFDSYANAKTNLKDIGFFPYLDIEVDKKTKWSYRDGELSFGLYSENNLEDEEDEFEHSEEACVHLRNVLFTVFHVYECTGGQYFLLVLNKNEV